MLPCLRFLLPYLYSTKIKFHIAKPAGYGPQVVLLFGVLSVGCHRGINGPEAIYDAGKQRKLGMKVTPGPVPYRHYGSGDVYIYLHCLLALSLVSSIHCDLAKDQKN